METYRIEGLLLGQTSSVELPATRFVNWGTDLEGAWSLDAIDAVRPGDALYVNPQAFAWIRVSLNPD